MISEKRFNFGVDGDHTYTVGMRIDLGMAPTYELLQRLFYDLYAQRRLSPSYLFMAEKDQIAMSLEMRNDPMIHRQQFYMSLEELSLRYIRSYATGCAAYVVPLPDLPQGSVIVGFFG